MGREGVTRLWDTLYRTPVQIPLGLSKNQKSSFLIFSRVNPGWIFYVDFKNINFFIIGGHLPCPLFREREFLYFSFSLNWLLNYRVYGIQID